MSRVHSTGPLEAFSVDLSNTGAMRVPETSGPQPPRLESPRGRSHQESAASEPGDRVQFSPQVQVPRPLPTDQELKALAQGVAKESHSRVPDEAAKSRHRLNALLQAQDWNGDPVKGGPVHYDGSPVVVIAFEGTGAFEARKAPAMQLLGRELQAQGYDTSEPRFKPDNLVTEALGDKSGDSVKWSGLSQGPLEAIVKDSELNQKVQWLSFPSEELELLSDPELTKNLSPKQLLDDTARTSLGTGPGIQAALSAVKDISQQAAEQGKSPKFVLLSHSSGGRSAVKFAEELKQLKLPVQVPLSISLDPVREAHEAVGEAGLELLNKGTEHNLNRVADFLGLPQKKVYPPKVSSQSQPESLYRPQNVDEWVSFYQKSDTEGLKMKPAFGIHGSPVAGAENVFIPDVGSAGHGEIAYHPEVIKRVTDELRELLPKR